MTLTGAPSDWTRQGVAELLLRFRGAGTNVAERMSVALNGTAVVYHVNPKAVQALGWTQWVIPLQAFADQVEGKGYAALVVNKFHLRDLAHNLFS